MATRQSTAERFWSKVRKAGPTECWLWTAGTYEDGYGQFRLGTTKVRAHRFSWTLAGMTIPEGHQVLHNCPSGDNPLCVNPAHLWTGTVAANMHDKIAKGRARYPGPKNFRSAKLTSDDVRAIRALLADGITQKEIAPRFNIDRTVICRIKSGKHWRSVS